MFEDEESKWMVYGAKMGIVIGLLLGSASWWFLGGNEYIIDTYSVGAGMMAYGNVIAGCAVGAAIFMIIGAFATLRGISMGSLKNIEMEEEIREFH